MALKYIYSRALDDEDDEDDDEAVLELFCGWPDAHCYRLFEKLFFMADQNKDHIVKPAGMYDVYTKMCQVLNHRFTPNDMTKFEYSGNHTEAMGAFQRPLKELLKIYGEKQWNQAATRVVKSAHEVPHIILGPVIGKVTDSTARILLECSHAAQVTLTIRPRIYKGPQHNPGPPKSETKQLPEHEPAIIKFDGLQPATRYDVTIEGAIWLVESCSFRTLPLGGYNLERGKTPRFVVYSCNDIQHTEKLRSDDVTQGDLWLNMKTRLANGMKHNIDNEYGMELDYLLHIGDNVYNDSHWCDIERGTVEMRARECKWGVAVHMLDGLNSRAEWETKRGLIKEVFQEVYYETWGLPSTRYCLANIPNLMIYDDHEIRDDWGDRPEDEDPNSKDYFMGEIAYEVINLYQRQLHEDLPRPYRRPTYDYHYHIFGDVGLFFIDVRGCKTFHKKAHDWSSPMLGCEQWHVLEDEFAVGGKFDKCKALLMLVPEPVAYLSKTFTMIAGHHLVDDALGMWSARRHLPEVPRFMNLLQTWKNYRRDVLGRDVLILGGDVHEGGWTDITYWEKLHPLAQKGKKGEPDYNEDRIRQLTTSAISNDTTQPYQAMAISVGRDLAGYVLDGGYLAGGWSCRHYDWTNNRNYAILSCSMAKKGSLVVVVDKLVDFEPAGFGKLPGRHRYWVSARFMHEKKGTQKGQTNEEEEPIWNTTSDNFQEMRFEVGDDDGMLIFQIKDGRTDCGQALFNVHQLTPYTWHRCSNMVHFKDQTPSLVFWAIFLPEKKEGKPPRAVITGQLISANEAYVTHRKTRTTIDETISKVQHFRGMVGEMGDQLWRFFYLLGRNRCVPGRKHEVIEYDDSDEDTVAY